MNCSEYRKIYREIKVNNGNYYLTGSLNECGEPLTVTVRNDNGELVYFYDKRFGESMEMEV